MHSDLKKFNVDFQSFYGFEPKRVDRRFLVNLSELSYLPKAFLPLSFQLDARNDLLVT